MPFVAEPIHVTSSVKPLKYKNPETVPFEEIEVDHPCQFEDVDKAVEACCKAQEEYQHMPMSLRYRIATAIRTIGKERAEELALCAISESKRGRYEDKVAKTILCCEKTPGPEELEPKIFTGEHGLCTVELGPFGVIASICPVTNPGATALNNAITVLSGGNGIVFSPHPNSYRITNRTVTLIHDAIIAAGGPQNLVVTIRKPSIESSVKLMCHPKIDGNLVTGGPAVVATALKSGKRCWCAGPGNPPVVVDETADLVRAAECIVPGASFDNNMICSDEKEVFVVDAVATQLIDELVKKGARLLSPEETEKVTEVCFAGNITPDYTHGIINKDLVGKDAAVVCNAAGITIPADCRLAICDVREGHPLVWTEQLLPVLPIVRVPDFETALKLAKRVEYNFKHTSSIYSNDMSRITRMGKYMNTSIFVANGPHTSALGAGGEGIATFSIAGHTGEGYTRPSTFVRERRSVFPNMLSIL